MKVSISLGGSLLTRDTTPENYRRYARILKELKYEGHQLVVVCGGGSTAREFISIAQGLGANDRLQDRLGILATHVNALLLIAALSPDAHPHVHRRRSEIKRNLGNRILVGGGHLPSSSTDYRAVLFAEAMGADLVVNATDINGVYNKNPEKFPGAVKLDRITFSRLEEIIIESAEQAPGEYGLFDLKAVKLARRLKIPMIFVDGTDPEEIIRAIDGGHSGTEIRDR